MEGNTMIYKLGPNRYQPRIYAGYDPSGRRIRARGAICRTLAEARRGERALLDARDQGHELVSTNLTVTSLIEAYIA